MADNQISSSYDGLHMPYSPEAEQALLGAIILESDVFDKVIEYIKSPDYFYVSLHKLIFKTMTEMVNFGGKIDFVILNLPPFFRFSILEYRITGHISYFLPHIILLLRHPAVQQSG